MRMCIKIDIIKMIHLFMRRKERGNRETKDMVQKNYIALLQSDMGRDLLNHLSEGIFVVNASGDLIFANQALLDMTGANLEYALSLNVFKFQKGGVQVENPITTVAFQEKRRITRISDVKITNFYSYKQMGTATPVLNEEGEVDYVVVELKTFDYLQDECGEQLCETRQDMSKEASGSETGGFICVNSYMKSLLATARKIADYDTNILITGETGTGKQVLVDYIISQSSDGMKKVIALNCSSIPEALFESELFGYDPGSFTGSSKTGKKGLFEAADGGVIFLDEINSMPLSMQGKLLRVLETKKYYRIGSTKERTLNCRFIAATNVNLKDCIANGTFRSDLYYRINIVSFWIPPLRERKEDIIPLVHYFLKKLSNKYNTVKMATPELMRILLNYDWPGNVRELRNVLEKLVIMTPEYQLYIDSIPSSVEFGGEKTGSDFLMSQEFYTNYMKSYYKDPDHFSLKECIEMYEAAIIKDIMLETKSTYKAAEILRMNQSSVARKIAKYHIRYKDEE